MGFEFLNHIWAKQQGLEKPYPLVCHLLDSATMISELVRVWLRPGLKDLLSNELGEQSEQILMLVAGLHDLGKANPHFQYQPGHAGTEWDGIRRRLQNLGLEFDSLVREEFQSKRILRRHENWSAFLLDLDDEERAADSWLLLALTGHHGEFHKATVSSNDYCTMLDVKDRLATSQWAIAHERLIWAVEEATGISVDDLPIEVSPTVTVLISGLLVLADRLASQISWIVEAQLYLEQNPEIFSSPSAWIDYRRDRARAIIDENVGIHENWSSLDQALTDILDGFPPRFTQEEALQQGDGLWNVMAATGSGKTESALLRHAQRNERLVFLLPTQATTNAIMRRVQKAYRSTSNVGALAHGMAMTEDFYTRDVSVQKDVSVKNGQSDDHYCDHGGLFPTEFVKSGASRLLAPVCVGTVDQALMASLPTKFNHLRLVALANSHVVIDEVHTLDQYQSELLSDLLVWLSATKTSVTFLTATMPRWQQQIFKKAYVKQCASVECFPSSALWPLDGGESQSLVIPTESYELGVDIEKVPFDSLVAQHVAWVKEMRSKFPSARIGLICNTVDRAQEVARVCAVELGEETVLLHSRMTAAHRRECAQHLESRIGKSGSADRVVVVGTQVIEASLDIDLDVLRTELCPAESLIQRAGRLWRREDANRCVRVPGVVQKSLSVAVIDEPRSFQTLPYFSAQLGRVERWLSERSSISFPDEAQDFIDASSMGLNELFAQLDDEADAEVLAEISSLALRRNAGLAAVVGFSDVLDEDVSFDAFSRVTARENVDEAATRLIESQTVPVIVQDSTGSIPGAWSGTVAELKQVRWNDSDKIKEALSAAIQVPASSKYASLLSRKEQIVSGGSLLCRYFVVEEASDFYDPFLGLVPELGV
ncbi:MAG: CRISPR-associated helicase Cas3' [Corynebacterium sp.]|uniref:CRISPR-associated helicase Cas3' n=1 Tax=Corynebacterium sp. TaxID=1720 RepID=UPI0026DD4691|nr:CRISPR-associated helicase Cas3' [Corynebacterium sp.]MDO4762325.1 CRISPR-associated helicase Cas3' [Corynebacterium sp.]